MARDPLQVLRRLREAAVNDAAKQLATAHAAERQQQQLLDAQRAQMGRERAELGDADVVDYAAWLPRARQQEEALQGALATQARRVAELRQYLVLRRTEAEIVAKLQERQAEEAALARLRKDQAVMDEAAGRSRHRKA